MVVLRSRVTAFVQQESVGSQRIRSIRLPAVSDAFEPSCVLQSIVDGAQQVAQRVENGNGISLLSEVLRPTWEAIEPLDLIVVLVLWELAQENGIIRLISRWTGREGKMKGTTKASQLRREVSLSWAIWVPLRRLLCRTFPLFYAVDISCRAIRAAGAPLPMWLQPAVALIGYGLFFSDLMRTLKRLVLARTFLASRPEKSNAGSGFISWKNRLDTVDRVGDVLVYSISAAIILELLALEIGFRLTSLLTFGGVGSLIIGLACQTPLSNIIAGIILAITNAFGIDDEVEVGEISGYVERLGWYNTIIRGYDNKIFCVPNSQISGETIINFSRAEYKRLNLSLTLRQEDIPRLSTLLPLLRRNIAALPEVVDDRVAHRALRVFLARFDEAGNPQIDIEIHLSTNDEDYFFQLRQNILTSVRRSLTKSGTSFASTAYAVSLLPPEFEFLRRPPFFFPKDDEDDDSPASHKRKEDIANNFPPSISPSS